MSDNYKITIQGIDRDLKCATGSYDSFEFSGLSQQNAEYIINQIEEIRDENDYSKGDSCPPSLLVSYNNSEPESFYLEKHYIFHALSNTKVSMENIFQLAKGEIKFDKQETRRESMENLGMNPIRQRHILPSNGDLKIEDIIYNENQPQFELTVWRSRSWLEATWTAPWAIGIFFLLIGIIVLSEGRDSEIAPIFFLISAICLLLFFPLNMFGKSKIIGGIDWVTNTLWIKRGKKVIGYAPDANYIEEIAIMRNDSIKHNPLWLSNPSSPMVFRKREWHLVFKKHGNDNFWTFYGSGFATKKVAMLVSEKFKELLQKEN